MSPAKKLSAKSAVKSAVKTAAKKAGVKALARPAKAVAKSVKPAKKAPLRVAAKTVKRVPPKSAGKPAAKKSPVRVRQAPAKSAFKFIFSPTPNPIVTTAFKPAPRVPAPVTPIAAPVVTPAAGGVVEDKRFCSSCQTRKPTQKGSYKTSRDGRHRRWICVDCLAKKIAR